MIEHFPEGWPDHTEYEEHLKCADILEDALPHVKSRMVAIDGGAHWGMWTVKLAEAFSVVMAFEPDPNNFHYLGRNCVGKKVALFQMALGDVPGPINMEFDERLHMAGHIKKTGNTTVMMGTIDNDAKIYPHLPVGLLKLDLEGYETKALEGGARTIRHSHPVIIVEDKYAKIRYGDMPPMEWLRNHGYHKVCEKNRDSVWVYEGID